MILHIVIDEKFIDSAYRVFGSVYPGQNKFLLVTKLKTFKYIKKAPVKTISPKEFLSSSFIKSLSTYDMVVLHWLDDMKMKMLARAPKDIKFVWVGWGGDYYDIIKGHESNLLKPLTKKLFDTRPKPHILHSVRNLLRRILIPTPSKMATIDKIGYFAPVLFEDYQLIKNSLPNFKPKYLSWNYSTLEDDMIQGLENVSISGENILLGNSASYPNNHLDTFEVLKAIPLSGRKIYCPLSYGDSILKTKIALRGQDIYGERFVPVIDFMPIKQYVQLISSCSIVIMNHLRQQAVGNIVIMMYLGAKIFLDKKNPVYAFFKKEGAFIYSLEEIAAEYSTRLIDDAINYNRRILKQHWSRDVILAKTQKLIETVLEAKHYGCRTL